MWDVSKCTTDLLWSVVDLVHEVHSMCYTHVYQWGPIGHMANIDAVERCRAAIVQKSLLRVKRTLALVLTL